MDQPDRLFPCHVLCGGKIEFSGDLLRSDLRPETLEYCSTLLLALRAGAAGIRHVSQLDVIHEVSFGFPAGLGELPPLAPFDAKWPEHIFTIGTPKGVILAVSMLVPATGGKELDAPLALLANLVDCESPEVREAISQRLAERPALLICVVHRPDEEDHWWDLLSFAMTFAAVLFQAALPGG
jgi:hypothetical protein